MRTISEPERRTLKAATDGAYTLAGGISRIVDFTRVTVSPLSKYASFGDEHAETFAPVDVAIEIDRAAKTPTIVKEMAALLGFDLVPARAGGEVERKPITAMDAHRVMSDSMDVSRAIIAALEDKRIDAAEQKEIARELRESIRLQEELLRRLEARA